MGSFSFIRADKSTKQNNFVPGDPIRILIPANFGGGSVKGIYEDYGKVRITQGMATNSEIDVYGMLAYHNASVSYGSSKVSNYLQFEGDKIPVTIGEIIAFGNTAYDKNRFIGIDLFHDYPNIPFPLKLVSASYMGSYEECEGVSKYDHAQGSCKTYWK